MTRIVVLTGAGISAESGLRTFRAEDGLWEEEPVEEVATPEGFARDPARVLRFYNERRKAAEAARPNAAHLALARLEAANRHDLLIVTQNVDDLHERAGSRRVIHMHGSLKTALCPRCRHRWPAPEEMRLADRCPVCGTAPVRPDIVWFGEMPYRMEEIGEALHRAELFVSIGTSGNVYPAAGFVAGARAAGARSLELNLEPSAGSRIFDATRQGPATKLVPLWVAEMLGDGAGPRTDSRAPR